MTLSRRAFLAASAAAVTSRRVWAADAKGWKFSFGRAAAGDTAVSADAVYSKDRGYGFEPGAKLQPAADGLTSDKPFFFSVAVPEGNYAVTVVLADPTGESPTTVKAELRRLVLENVAIAKGKTETRTFALNVRTPRIADGVQVKLKDRERKDEAWAWDEKLTLEFNGARPCVCRVEVSKADISTVYLLGDSTVCDQPHEPYASWGQMLPRFFGPSVAVSNQAESGESAKSSRGARRFDKVLATMRAGDYLLVQFGHNDMKAVTADAYRADLKRLVADARKAGGTPVLVTSMHRRSFQGKTITNSLKDFPDAVRSLAKADAVPLIDLHAMSETLYEALGPDDSGRLFKTGDGTHHNNYGAYELAKCVVEGIRTSSLDLRKLLSADVKPFDPAKPDPFDAFKLPASPQTSDRKPDGM